MRGGRSFLAVMAMALMAIPLWRASGDPDDRWIVEPTPEDPQAIKAGASELERALGLAKRKNYAQAVPILEVVARRFPAALHDCNLSLAYLRAGALTRAQLMWDVAGLRNAVRPNWCTGDLSTQLETALRAAGYVPVSIEVTPPTAVIEVGGVAVRGIKVLWLATGPATIAAHAPGKLDVIKQSQITAPSARIQIDLADPPVVEPDAGVVQPSADAAVVAPPDAAIVVQPPPIVDPPKRSKLPYIAGGAAAIGWIGGTTFYFLARGARADADKLFVDEPAFDDAKSKFEIRRIVAYSLLGVGAVATGYLTYWLFTRKSERISVQPTAGGAAVTIGGAW